LTQRLLTATETTVFVDLSRVKDRAADRPTVGNPAQDIRVRAGGSLTQDIRARAGGCLTQDIRAGAGGSLTQDIPARAGGCLTQDIRAGAEGSLTQDTRAGAGGMLRPDNAVAGIRMADIQVAGIRTEEEDKRWEGI
jgi:hypothetical protein